MPDILHQLPRFDALTFRDGVSAAFVLGYRPEDRSGDLWSDRFTSFKFNPYDASEERADWLMAQVARRFLTDVPGSVGQ